MQAFLLTVLSVNVKICQNSSKKNNIGGPMLPLNPWEHQNIIKVFYARCVEPVCVKHQITRIELDILLFLANNPLYDTATDIVEIRYLSKSQVSAAIKLLEKQGFLTKRYVDGNRKTVHLAVSGAALPIVADGRAAQEKCFAIMLQDFTEEEKNQMKRYNQRIWDHITHYLKEESE